MMNESQVFARVVESQLADKSTVHSVRAYGPFKDFDIILECTDKKSAEQLRDVIVKNVVSVDFESLV